MNITRVSEQSLLIELDQTISHKNFLTIGQLVQRIENTLGEVIIDMIPSYASIHITFNFLAISGQEFVRKLEVLALDKDSSSQLQTSHKTIEIPVYYGSEVGPDLALVAQTAGLSEDEVIHIHASQTYDVYAIGFAPGFAYLGEVDKRIALPRKETPRAKVAKGSLGIAGSQTAVYPSDSPGGWQIIGRSPMELLDYNSEQLSPFSTGDSVRFRSISREEYVDLGGEL